VPASARDQFTRALRVSVDEQELSALRARGRRQSVQAGQQPVSRCGETRVDEGLLIRHYTQRVPQFGGTPRHQLRVLLLVVVHEIRRLRWCQVHALQPAARPLVVWS
jgi:hypothetical protein